MDIQVILLLVLTAFLHSAWNILAKNSVDKHVFLCLSLWASSLIYLVPFIYRYSSIPLIGWVFIVLSGMLETVYFILLGNAYDHGEVSLLYPLARGSAPLLVVVFAACFLGERISLLGFMGIMLILLGINFVFLQAIWQKKLDLQAIPLKGVGFALLTGVAIACYSVVDKKGVSFVDPFVYIYLVFLVAACLLTPLAMAKRTAVIAALKQNKGAIIFVGFVQVIAYLLVLIALTRSKVSYVSAVREMSVIMTPILSALYLKEVLTCGKMIGSAAVFMGIVLVAVAK